MGKKKLEIGITEQLLLGEEMEQDLLITVIEADEIVLETKDEKRARKAAEKALSKLIEKVLRAVEKTSVHLETENSTAGAELINVLDAAYQSHVVFDNEGTPRGMVELGLVRFGAYVNGGIALVPELHALAIGFKNDADSDYEGWMVADVMDVLGSTSIEQINDGSFKQEQIEPLLGWLKELRGK